jgi:uncharacterized membrane protein YccC
MHNPYDIPWKRIFAEGVAIVVSILLAFWIDAWWAAGRESDEVREMLSAVLEDFQRSKSRVDSRRSFASARQDSIARLLELSNGQPAELDGVTRFRRTLPLSAGKQQRAWLVG